MEEKTLMEAFLALQCDMQPVVKDRDNPFLKSNYATLLAIVAMLRPLQRKHGVGYTQTVVSAEGEKWMETVIFKPGDEARIVSRVPFSCASQKAQDIGSVITYMKRYGLQCAFGIVVIEDESDDDGNRVSGVVGKAAKQPW